MLTPVERIASSLRNEMDKSLVINREKIIQELGQLALYGEKESTRVKALDVLANRFPEVLEMRDEDRHKDEGNEFIIEFRDRVENTKLLEATNGDNS